MFDCIVFKPTKQQKFNKSIVGFDIETTGKKNKFYMASLVGEINGRYQELVFYDTDKLIQFFKQGHLKDSIIVATNLSFDFFGLFNNKDDIDDFSFVFRGSNLLLAKTYIYNSKFNLKSNHHKTSLRFIDTMNFCPFSVKDLGKIIKFPKLKKPKCLGRKPRSKKELKELEKYNIRDSAISYKFLRFLFSGFVDLGATPKITVASTSMSCFKNKYLKDVYFRHNKETLLELFEGYYGGRTEIFKRGYIKNFNYYDINSLYPSVMEKHEYPNPNTHKVSNNPKIILIKKYHGVSDVMITCPKSLKIPLLPYRHDNKLIFPTGKFRGWYSHIELREALKLGYKIKRIYKTHYYTGVCRPFKDYVNDLYKLRLKYKSNNNPMQLVVKLLLNSLYGKFGQKFIGKDDLIPIKQLNAQQITDILASGGEILGNKFVRVKKDVPPSSFCIPIWSLHVTAYGRLELYKYLSKYQKELIYCDTDSITLKSEIPESMSLGDISREYILHEAIFVKPKFYCIKGLDEKGKPKDFSRIKGVSGRMKLKEFKKVIDDPKVYYKKFTKLRESLRRHNLDVNEIQDVKKVLNLEDNKRDWRGKTFNRKTLQSSKALCINDT